MILAFGIKIGRLSVSIKHNRVHSSLHDSIKYNLQMSKDCLQEANLYK